MTPEYFKRDILNKAKEIQSFVNSKAPRILGKLAVDHFKNNFRKGSFDGQKWKAPQRLSDSGGASGKYGTLLSSTAELMNSINYRVEPGKVIISSDKVYARIHNEGGNISIPITAKMRKFAWAKHYEETGNGKGDSKWKGMALTKKQSLNVQMPRRQFMGNSIDLENQITKKLEEHLTLILK